MSNDTLKDEIGRRLRRILDDRKLSQTELAERAGITQPMMSLYVNGKREPSVATLKKIADALGIDISALT